MPNLTAANNPIVKATPDGIAASAQTNQTKGQLPTPPERSNQQPFWLGSALGNIPNPSAIKPSPGFPQPTGTAQQPGQFPRKVAAILQEEILRGGKGDGKPDSEFNRKSLRLGIKSELEHTRSSAIAKEIAKDHLVENSRAYEKESKAAFPYRLRPVTVSGQECFDEIEERFMNSVAKRNSGSTLQEPMTLGGLRKQAGGGNVQAPDLSDAGSSNRYPSAGRKPVADLLFGSRSAPSALKSVTDLLQRDSLARGARDVGGAANWWSTEGTHHVGPTGRNLTPLGKALAIPALLAPAKMLKGFGAANGPSQTGINWRNGALIGAGALAGGLGGGALLGAGALAGAGGLYAAYRYLNRKKKPDEEEDKTAEVKCADVTPFAAGFFISCRTKGYSLPQVREFTKIACETDAKIAEQLSCLDNNFWLFMTASKQAGIGNSIGNMFDSGTQWLSQTAPVQYVANKFRDSVVTPAKTYVEGQLQQGAANEVGKRMDALGFNPESGIGKFFVDYNKEGLMPAITNAWGGMTPAQQMSLLAMIGGPLIGAGTAMAGHPGLGAMIGLGGLAAGGAGMYFGGNNKPTPALASASPQPVPTQQQPIQAQPMAQPTVQPPAATDETAALNKGFKDMQPTTTLTNPGGPALPKPPTSDGITP
jgi:hypothetical protein